MSNEIYFALLDLVEWANNQDLASNPEIFNDIKKIQGYLDEMAKEVSPF